MTSGSTTWSSVDVIVAVLQILVPSTIAVVAAFLSAYWTTRYADLSRKRHDKEIKAKVINSLLSQTEIAKHVRQTNETASVNPGLGHVMPVYFPTTPFDIAIFSTNAIAISESTQRSIRKYYSKALELNALIYALLELPSDKSYFDQISTFKNLQEQVKNEMPQLISNLETKLRNEP